MAPAGTSATALISNKWAATAASIWIQSTSGTPSTFGIYSSALKSSQDYSQSTLDTVALFKDIGANTGILAGVLYAFAAVTPRRLRRGTHYLGGPKVVILAGSVQCFLGYFLTWLTVVGVIRRPPVAVVCMFMFFAGHSMPFFNTANVVTSVHNFRDFNGTVVGIMKGFLGLSGAMLIQLYRSIFKGDSAGFLLMVSVLCTVNPLWLMWFVNIDEARTGNEKELLDSFSIVTLAIAAHLLIVIILESVVAFSLWAHIVVLVILLLLLASPLVIVLIRAVRLGADESNEVMPTQKQQDDDEKVNVGYHELCGDGDEEENAGEKSSELKEDLSLFQAMRTMNFWLLFLASACGIGSGLATVNNIAQIGESLGYSSAVTSTLVSLWGIWNSLGRFGAGYTSDYILHNMGWPRPLVMAITLATMSIGHVLISSELPGALYVGSIVVGICYGSQLSLMPTIASEIFGVVHMGTIFNAITAAGPVGSYILSVWVIGYVYDREATGERKTCTGVHCFMLSFLLMAGVTLFGSIFAMTLYLKTKSFYGRIIADRRIRHPDPK